MDDVRCMFVGAALKARCSGGGGGFGESAFRSGRKAAMAARELQADRMVSVEYSRLEQVVDTQI